MVHVNETIRVGLIGTYNSIFLTDPADVFNEISLISPGITNVASSQTLVGLERSVNNSELDVLIITSNSDGNLSATIKQARTKYSDLGILIINDCFDCDLFASGCDGLIIATHSIDTSIKGIKAVSKRNFFFADCIYDYCIDAAIENIIRPPLRLNIDGLDTRDMDIIIMTAKGLTNSEIAEELTISAKTIEKRRTDIYKITGCNDQRGLTVFALKNNIVHLCDL